MPQRYSNTTMCYRDEQSGELNGLSRVRAFTQDDAHVFCRYSQAKEELSNAWNIIEEFYKAFGFELNIRLSFHDPEHMESYLGDQDTWKKSEAELKELVEARGSKYYIGIGEAAFYGPKIDFIGSDSLGREWQLATIQLDMLMPERFGLTYTGENGEDEPVLMLHVAVAGSVERFMSILIEDTAGNFPFWLAPVQVTVLPVSDQFIDAASEIVQSLRDAGLRVELDASAESVGKKIRNASIQKIPAKIVLGQQEIDSKQFKVNWRTDLAHLGEDLKSLPQLITDMTEINTNRTATPGTHE